MGVHSLAVREKAATQVQSALEMAHSATARQNDLTTMLEESEQEQVRLQFEVP